MNVLAGLYRAEEGSISIYGQRVNLNSPRDAIAHGVGMVHQHFMLVPTQTVTEKYPARPGRAALCAPPVRVRNKVLALQDKYGLKVDPRAKIWQLSVGEQQRVEI